MNELQSGTRHTLTGIRKQSIQADWSRCRRQQAKVVAVAIGMHVKADPSRPLRVKMKFVVAWPSYRTSGVVTPIERDEGDGTGAAVTRDGRPMLDVDALQGALRMLFLLDRCGEPPAAGSRAATVGAVAVIKAEKKLQALHFWMRNPDYLAYEVLSRVEAGEFDSSLIDRAEELLDGDEPELRLYPMLRHRFGAFEPIDDSFSYLTAAGLAECHRSGSPGQVQRTDLFLLQAGRDAANQILADEADMQWYADRADLVAAVGRTLSGNAAKDRQYELSRYAETALGDRIQPVDDIARTKLAELRESR